MTNTETRITKASKELAKATMRIAKGDQAMADRLVKVLADEMERIRQGR